MILIGILCLLIGFSKLLTIASNQDKLEIGIEDTNLPIKIDPQIIKFIIGSDGFIQVLAGLIILFA